MRLYGESSFLWEFFHFSYYCEHVSAAILNILGNTESLFFIYFKNNAFDSYDISIFGKV
jgi:cellulose synthase/poly-beta-1,6-N-acetylglucosamine synthase-like glycosyltransferase